MIIAAAGIIILLLSVAGAAVIAGRGAMGQPRQVKILRFVLFFWLLAFIQLIVAALGYALLRP
ncbi:MAG: hypothetical protein R3F42_15175 [Pseudomonadota bacterium]